MTVTLDDAQDVPYMIVVVPAIPLVTIPLAEPIVATADVPVLQVPPGTASLSVMLLLPEHTLAKPDIAPGMPVTVTDIVAAARQPVEYVMSVVPPVPVPVTTPETEPTVATVVLLLVHVPPAVASLKVMLAPEHIAATAGDMATGVPRTVTECVAFVPQPVE